MGLGIENVALDWMNELRKCLCFDKKFLIWQLLTQKGPSRCFRESMSFIMLNANYYLGKGFYGFHHLPKGFCDSQEFKDQGTQWQQVLVKTSVKARRRDKFSRSRDKFSGAGTLSWALRTSRTWREREGRHEVKQAGALGKLPGCRSCMSKPWAFKKKSELMTRSFKKSVQNYSEAGYTLGLRQESHLKHWYGQNKTLMYRLRNEIMRLEKV